MEVYLLYSVLVNVMRGEIDVYEALKFFFNGNDVS